VHQRGEIVGRKKKREKERERRRERERERGRASKRRGGYLIGVVTQSTSVPFISRNIILQNYWPIRTSCLYEAPIRFSFMCPTTLLCAL